MAFQKQLLKLTTDKMEAAPKRVFICLPKKHIAELSKNYDLEHGLFVKGLNPYLNEGYVQAYFREWGNVTGCKIKKASSTENNKALAYVRFASEKEADIADWNGPHFIGGTEVTVKRVVSPKVEGEKEEQVAAVVTKPRPRRSMGLGYILEDAQWLDDELEE
ncbi:ribonucleoprotein RB97D [Boleophthalmus pectinirostris]|uniref:ribonucleoprotein RB97D n=1 Tax=Boleophthalmus pectinirostris TaxID=150288 RepID=UPI00242DBEF9|nr:ribonucleoprotein RB97D [Boleophthalmus pectinirostris]